MISYSIRFRYLVQPDKLHSCCRQNTSSHWNTCCILHSVLQWICYYFITIQNLVSISLKYCRSWFTFWSTTVASIQFPTNFQPPLADSDAIVVNMDDPPEPGNYRYNLQVTVITQIIPQSVTINSVEMNITITETPGGYIVMGSR